MSGSQVVIPKNEDAVRTLDGGVFLLHYAHAKSGVIVSAGCRGCREGMEAVVVLAPARVAVDSVAEGTGDDEKDSPASAPAGEGDW